MNKILGRLHALILQLPATDNDVVVYKERFHKYRTECGCSLGGAFCIASLLLCTGYNLINRNPRWRTLLIGLGIVFTSSIAGKFLGIGIARIKLLLLLRRLSRKLRTEM